MDRRLDGLCEILHSENAKNLRSRVSVVGVGALAGGAGVNATAGGHVSNGSDSSSYSGYSFLPHGAAEMVLFYDLDLYFDNPEELAILNLDTKMRTVLR